MASTPRARAVPHLVEEGLLRYEELWDEPAVDRRLGDTEALQGAWLSTGGRRQAEFIIAGTCLTAHFADGDIYMGTFTLGNWGSLGTMDVSIDEGPPHHKGQVALCIYEVRGDSMRWCTASPGQGERPSGFKDSDRLTLCLEFHREPSRHRYQELAVARSRS